VLLSSPARWALLHERGEPEPTLELHLHLPAALAFLVAWLRPAGAGLKIRPLCSCADDRDRSSKRRASALSSINSSDGIPMKAQELALAAALVGTLAACGQKSEVAPKAPAIVQEATQKAQEAVQQVKTEVMDKVQEPVKKAVEEGTKAVKQTAAAAEAGAKNAAAETAVAAEAAAKKTAAVAKSETEQALASTLDHARTVTKSQESKSRSRAQKAEDEMMDLDKK
jgi:hypothetical protein